MSPENTATEEKSSAKENKHDCDVCLPNQHFAWKSGRGEVVSVFCGCLLLELSHFLFQILSMY